MNVYNIKFLLLVAAGWVIGQLAYTHMVGPQVRKYATPR